MRRPESRRTGVLFKERSGFKRHNFAAQLQSLTDEMKDQSAWLSTLSSTDCDVATVALRTYEGVVGGLGLVGGCYILSFFLYMYLKQSKGIEAEVVVGWVNDGTSPLMISHAWIETNRKKTDISLTRTEVPTVQLPGPLVILDRIIIPGHATYTYHRERPPEAILELREVDPFLLKHLETEHSEMVAVAKSDKRIAAYFKNAPPDLRYEALLRHIS